MIDIIKDMNQVMHDGDAADYRIPDEKECVAQLLLSYEMSGGSEQEKWVNYDYTTLRLLAEVKEFNTGEIEQEFRVLKRLIKELFPEAKLNMAGTVVQFSVVQNYITKGEVVSTRTAIQKTFQIVGSAIFMTSLIVAVAFSVYMASIAVFFFHLSILFIAGVVAALLADYVCNS